MSASNVKGVPEGMHSVTPHLICANAADAIEFYKKAFGAQELSRLPMPNGKLAHAMIKIGDSTIMMADEAPEWQSVGPATLKGTPVVMHLYVDDADAQFERAVAAGATVKMPLADMFWGDRYGTVQDPFGHVWSIATHQRDVSREDMVKGMQQMCQ